MDLLDHWSRQPPVNELVAMYLGVKPRAKAVDEHGDDPESDAMINRVSKPEFDALLAQHGLPIGASDEREQS